MVTWPLFGHVIKGLCLGVSFTKSAACLLCWPYFFCRQRHVLYLSRDFTTPLHWGTLKNLVAIGILIVKRENTSSKTWINSYSHWKIAWAPGERKMSQTQKITFWDKEPESYKSHIIFSLHFITMFYNFALKIESSRAKRVVKSISEARVTIVIWSIHSWIKKN